MFDFNRCSKEQLVRFADAFIGEAAKTNHHRAVYCEVYNAAEVPLPEKKSEVAKELAQLCCTRFDDKPSQFGLSLDAHDSNAIRELVGRYQKAVDG